MGLSKAQDMVPRHLMKSLTSPSQQPLSWVVCALLLQFSGLGNGGEEKLHNVDGVTQLLELRWDCDPGSCDTKA